MLYNNIHLKVVGFFFWGGGLETYTPLLKNTYQCMLEVSNLFEDMNGNSEILLHDIS